MQENMTEGKISKKILMFAIPMILGNMFQLTYNAVDSIIVGNFAGETTLAAIGTANPIMNIIIFFIVGICLGASILMSEFYGSGNMEKFKREVSTTMIIGVIFTMLVTVICYIFSPYILRIINTPDEIFEMSNKYLRVIFLGLIFTFFYNAFAAALKSIGDSKTPLYFLAISSILNGCLDLVFVAKFHMGVVGAAYATVIAEAVSSILCIVYVYLKVPLVRLKINEIKLDKSLIGKTISYSWATAMQQTVLHIGKVLVQGSVNTLGVDAIAAFNAVNRVDDFAFTPQQSIAQAMTVFIAQNRGAHKKERIHKGFKETMKIESIYWLCLMIIVLISAPIIMSLFVKDKESDVIVLGAQYLRYMAFFYILPAWTNGIQGYFRGMGKMRITLYSTSVQMLFRVLFVFLLVPFFGFSGIAYACFGGWMAMLIFEVPQFIKEYKSI